MTAARLRLLVAGMLTAMALAVAPGSADAANIVTLNNFAIAASEPDQTGRLIRTAVESTCASQKANPGLGPDSDPRNYRNHTFVSHIVEPACITVDVTTACTNPSEIFSVAYHGTFNPANPSTNYAADLGWSPPTETRYSFVETGGGFFSIVIHMIDTGQTCSGYNLTVSSDRPWATSVPAISGAASVGGVLTGSDAVWRETPTVQRRWRRCDSDGTGCTDIPGATATTYTVTDDDLGHALRYVNVATDGGVSSTAQSRVVDPYIPFETHTGESLGVGDRFQQGLLVRSGNESTCGVPITPSGIANPAQTFLFETFAVRSLLNEPVCVVARTVRAGMCLNGVSPTIYSPAFVPADLTANYAAYSAQPLEVPNAAGWSMPAGAGAEVSVTTRSGGCPDYGLTLGANGPFATARPTIDGAAIERGTLAVTSNGTWSGAPTFSHSWLRCDANGDACAPIDGATGTSYSPGPADVGGRLRVRVTATQGPSVSSDSEPSGVVAANPVVNDPADVLPPDATMRLGSRNLARALKRGRIPVVVTCNEQCTALVKLRIARRLAKRLHLAKTVVIARARGTVAAGAKTTLRAKLPKRVRRSLRGRHALKLTLRGTFTDAAGNVSALTGKGTLRRPR